MPRSAAAVLVLCIATFLAPHISSAQYNYNLNYQTNTITVASNWVGNAYVVGSNTYLNALVVQGGGVLSSGAGLLGYDTGGSNNAAIITGTGSVWSNLFDVNIGGSGSSANVLVISNGGLVSSAYGNFGFTSVSCSNIAIVTDPGSAWSNHFDLNVGLYGNCSQLIVSNGGLVFNERSGVIGYYAQSSNNVAVVTGTNSVWCNGTNDFGGLYVGVWGSSNQLVVSNGGKVINTGAGYFTWSSPSKNNSALVTGEGSVWINRRGLLFGGGGGGNRLVVSNGGALISSSIGFGQTLSNTIVVSSGGAVFTDDLLVNGNVATCDNSFTVAGGSLYVTNSTHSAEIEVRRGIFTFSAGIVMADKLVVTNPCARFIHTGGTLLITSFNLAPNLDADGDGIANGYEQSYGLDPFNPNDADSDVDGDGSSNLQEYLAGTGPTNAASVFRILDVVRTNNDMRVTWATAGGRTNVVQSADSVTGGYTNISPDILVAGSGDTTTNFVDTGGATNSSARLYRIRLVP